MNPPQINQTPETQSALLPLPRELRDCIYEHLLTETFSVTTLGTGDPSSSLPLHRHSHLAILNVSKSTCEEAKKVLYKHGQFRFDTVFNHSPCLREEIRNVPAIEMLQDINICLDVRVLSLVKFATTLINYFAALDSGVPRKRCVVETVSSSLSYFLYSSTRDLINFRDAVCRLTGFQVVELKMWESHGDEHPDIFRDVMFACLGEVLVPRFGNEERVYGQEYVRCIFYPRQEQSRAAPR